jgi:hypothetical protein
MAVIDAELYVQAMDLEGEGRERLFEATLRQIPGVSFVSPREHTGPSAERCVQIAFDPEQTNPVIIKDVLGRIGFNVLSARETEPAGTSDVTRTARPEESR